MSTLEAEAALQDILSRKIYETGWLGFSELGLEVLQKDIDPNEMYYELGDAFISIQNYNTVVTEAARGGLLPPGLPEQERVNTLVDLYKAMKDAGRLSK